MGIFAEIHRQMREAGYEFDKRGHLVKHELGGWSFDHPILAPDERPDIYAIEEDLQEYFPSRASSGTRFNHYSDWEELKANAIGRTLYAQDPDETHWRNQYVGYYSPASHPTYQDGWIETVVKGVTFAGRQAVVQRLAVGDQIWLCREPDNPHDAKAVRVQCQNGTQIGYVPREIAATIASALDRFGRPLPGRVTAITGAGYPNSNLGVRIRFRVSGAGMTALAELMAGDDEL